MKFVHAALLAVAMTLSLPVAAQTLSDMQILADKLKADKKLLVAANMELTDAEAKRFWPVYEAYQKDLQKLNQRTAAVIKHYADAYNKGPVSDATAEKLIGEALAIEEAEAKMRRSYLPKLKQALPGMKVARYLQLESKVRAVIRYELASEIPLVE